MCCPSLLSQAGQWCLKQCYPLWSPVIQQLRVNSSAALKIAKSLFMSSNIKCAPTHVSTDQTRVIKPENLPLQIQTTLSLTMVTKTISKFQNQLNLSDQLNILLEVPVSIEIVFQKIIEQT